jgi:hypothetical protein
MDTFCNYNNAFNNDVNENLDKMARKLNNDRKKLPHNIKNDILNQYNESTKLINYMSNNETAQPYGFFSTQGNYADILNSEKSSKFDSDSESMYLPNSENKSMFSYNTLKSDSNYLNDISSNYSSLPSKMKYNMRLNTKHLKDYNEKDDNKIIDHIKKCNECKNELLLILTKSHINKSNIKLDSYTNDINNKSYNEIINFNISNNELKDIFILILIGIFIIIIIDMFIR